MASHFINPPMTFSEIQRYYAAIVGASPAAADDRLRGVTSVKIFVPVDKHPQEVGTADVVRERTGELRRVLHNHELPKSDLQDMVVVRNVFINAKHGDLPYPYTFRTQDEVPDRLRDMYRAGYFAWDSKALLAKVGKGKSGSTSSSSKKSGRVVKGKGKGGSRSTGKGKSTEPVPSTD